MARTTVIVMVDGLDPEYLRHCPAPNFTEIARQGFMVEAKAMMPTVTNVNNTSLVTASYPHSHGIVSNYWWDRSGDAEVYMESGEFVCAETMFQRAARQGARSLMVSSKDKLRRLLGDADNPAGSGGAGPTLAFSSEQAPSWVVDAVGNPPEIYSLEVNGWIVDAARYAIAREHYDLVYLTTTDYAMHTYGPEAPESARHLALFDTAVGKLLDSLPDAEILITADHGMSAKSRMIHLPAVLAQHGIAAHAVPIIKDLYTVHHSNLGGCIYVYVDPANIGPALQVLNHTDGVDEALSREEAARRFRLMGERIGDIMVLGSPGVVFGNPDEVEMPPNLRSHGSLYEQDVPIIGCGGSYDGFHFRENLDVGRYVFERALA